MLSFEPYTLVKNVLDESLKGDKKQTLDFQRILTEKFIQSNEAEQNELFATKTLTLIFEYSKNELNENVLHILSLMLLFTQQFQRVKFYMDESQEQFDLFVGYFKYIATQEVSDFYQQILRAIKFDTQDTCNRMSKFLVRKLSTLDDQTTAQNLQDIMNIILVKQNAPLNIQLMTDLTKILNPASSKLSIYSVSDESEPKKKSSDRSMFCSGPSTLGMGCVLPKLFGLANKILNNIDEQQQYSVLTYSQYKQDTTKKSSTRSRHRSIDLQTGSELLRACLSDDSNSDIQSPDLREFLSPQVEQAEYETSPVIPKSIDNLNLHPQLNMDPYDDGEGYGLKEQASTFFQVRAASVEVVSIEGQTTALRFSEAVRVYCNHLCLSTKNQLPSESSFQFLLLICESPDLGEDFFKKLRVGIERLNEYALSASGVCIGYLFQILKCFMRNIKQLPFTQIQMLPFYDSTRELFQQGVNDVVQKLFSPLQQFQTYVQNNGLVPVKRRTPFVSLVMQTYKELYNQQNKVFIYQKKQDNELDFYLVSDQDIENLWYAGQIRIQGQKCAWAHRYSELDDCLKESNLSEQFTEILNKVEVSSKIDFKYQMFVKKVDQEVKKIAPKYIGITLPIKIGGGGDDSSSEDEQFNKQLENIMKARKQDKLEQEKAELDEEDVTVGQVSTVVEQLRKKKWSGGAAKMSQ
ncbi:Conserved_hypothetical protein [Hexamita inflata]|uniref:Uncharacterized protein n=1 Tax=Hexamita inflata TaxID=28002 RepID=A0AA86QKB8_9EUKA|nr:Conserved hypothetical protein [Hexamita inflata]